MYLYIYIHTETEKLIKTISILLFTDFCFTNMISLPKNAYKDLFSNSVLYVSFALGQFSSPILSLALFWFLFDFFILGGRKTNTSKTIFLLVVQFIKTYGIQLLMLRVTLYLDGCEALDCMKFAPVPHVPGGVPIWTIPYCTLDSKVLVILPQFIMA